jgi:hypothetical protein
MAKTKGKTENECLDCLTSELTYKVIGLIESGDQKKIAKLKKILADASAT